MKIRHNLPMHVDCGHSRVHFGSERDLHSEVGPSDVMIGGVTFWSLGGEKILSTTTTREDWEKYGDPQIRYPDKA